MLPLQNEEKEFAVSGPKSSRYTLTAAQRRALAEQLERERQLRIQAERDERQRNENFSLYSDVDALVKQNNRLIDDANQVQRETEMKVVSAGNAQSTTKLLGERAKAICNQIRNAQGNELLEQKQSLIEIKSTLRTLYSELNNDISEVQSQHRKQLESVINDSADLSFDAPSITKAEPHKSTDNRQSEAEARQKCINALADVKDSALSSKLKDEYNGISTKLADIQTRDFFENYYSLTIVPFLKECKEWKNLVERIGEKFKAAESEYRVLCEEQDEQVQQFDFSEDGLANLEAEVNRLKTAKLDDEEQAYISQTIDDVMVEMGYKLIGNNEVTKKSGKHFKKELYLFDEGTAVNVTTSSTGQITMELGLLDTQDRIPDVEETDTLCRQMRTFCGSYADIEKKLAERGIVAKHLSLLPPEAQFAQVINVEDYNMSDDETYVKEKKKATASEQKAMHY